MESLLAAGLINLLLASILALVVLLAAWRCRRPALLHSLWLLVLIKLLTPPLLSVPILEAAPPPAPLPPPPSEVASLQGSLVMVPEVAGPDEPHPGHVRFKPMLLKPGPNGVTLILTEISDEQLQQWPAEGNVRPLRATPSPAQPSEPPRPDYSWIPRVLAILWLAGTTVLLLWTFMGLWRFQRLLRFARQAPPQVQAQVQALTERMGPRRCPVVWLVPGPLPPLVWAVFGRARLYFPRDLLQRLDEEGQAALFAHELAHVCRRDHWVRWLELAAVALYWWCPLVWWARARLRACEEECCDAWVVEQLSPRVYAGAILETVDFLAQPIGLIPSTASTLGRIKSLKRRLIAIMTRRHFKGMTRRGRFLVLLLACLLPLVPGRAKPPAVEPEGPMPARKTAASRPEEGPFFAQQSSRSLPHPILALAVSPTGQRMALALEDHQIAIHDVATGDCIWLLAGHEDTVTALAFSPDGKTLLSGSPDLTVRMWDMATGKERACLKAHTSWVYAVAFSPDGALLASAGYDRDIRLWNARTHQLAAILRGHTASVRALAFSPDGQWLASGGGDGVVRLWDVRTRRERYILQGHARTVRTLHFAPDGKTLASGSEDGTIRLWDVQTGKERVVMHSKNGEVWTVMFSAQGRFLVSGGSGQAVQVWDTVTFRERQVLKGHTDGITGVVLMPDGKTILSVSLDRTVRIWNALEPVKKLDSETRWSIIFPVKGD